MRRNYQAKGKQVDGDEHDTGSCGDFAEGMYRLGAESFRLYRTAGASEIDIQRKVAEVIRFLEAGDG